jgi:hypothetical protein
MKWRMLCLLSLLALPAQAHEVWLQPAQFVSGVDETIDIGMKVNDGKGVRDATLEPSRVLRFELVKDDRHMPLTLRAGEVPAATVPVPQGTSVLVVETEPKHVDLAADKFTAYLREQGLTQILAERRKRGEVQKTAREDYMRCMKALLTTDEKNPPHDYPQGCPYELVLRRQVSRTLTFETLRHGDPEPGQQVRFWNLDTGKLIRTLRSDKNGRVTLPLPPGRWLATSTAMRRSSELQTDWRSDWASVTWQHFSRK